MQSLHDMPIEIFLSFIYTHMTKINDYDFMAPKVKAITAERAQLLKRCKRTADTKFIAAKKPKKFTDVQQAQITTTNKQQDEIKLWFRMLRNPETNDYSIDVFTPVTEELQDEFGWCTYITRWAKTLCLVPEGSKLLQTKWMGVLK